MQDLFNTICGAKLITIGHITATYSGHVFLSTSRSINKLRGLAFLSESSGMPLSDLAKRTYGLDEYSDEQKEG